ncbi:MAG: hypothetical protein ACKPKO_55480, partial [Candidatus Fonsibacter sp.]
MVDVEAARRLRELMRGATTKDWLSLAMYDDMCEGAYVYNHAMMTAMKAKDTDIPWPFIWLATRFHEKKHIHCGRRLP